MPEADTKIMTFVKEAADRFSTLGATVEEVSVPMHFDGKSLPFILVSFYLYVDLKTMNFEYILFHCICQQEFEYAMRFAWKAVIDYFMVSTTSYPSTRL